MRGNAKSEEDVFWVDLQREMDEERGPGEDWRPPARGLPFNPHVAMNPMAPHSRMQE